MDETQHRNIVKSRLGETMKHGGIRGAEYSGDDETGFEVRWGQWPIFSQVKGKDVQLLKALVALRVQTLCKNNALAARTLPLA